MPAKFTHGDVARFWKKVDRRGPDDCWLWLASTNASGYGQFSVGGRCGRPELAHRIAWMVANGPIPVGLCVLHNCPGGDNPACVNPAHLWLGTRRDNSRDMDAKGRRVSVMGECVGTAKLDPARVRDMRNRYAMGGVSTRVLAREYGISKSQVFSIVAGDDWKHA